ncbi:MAG: polysaccharide biosynthesis protein, partial [Rhodoferax sp.]|nr:polysaccharide biosynthesis protein [Rhodoferax sp.]
MSVDPVAHPTAWHRLDAWLARLRPHRRGLALTIDAATVFLCWNATYLFRLGFERWVRVRPDYDPWVIAGIVVAYAAAFLLLRVPQGLWRFSGFGEVKRLALACALAGAVSAVVVMGLGLVKVPRAVLALHPVVTLMGVVLVRMAYRMLYEHARQRITGSDREIRRALVLGAGGAARRLLAGIHQHGWVVLGLLDDDPAKQGASIAGVPVLGTLEAVRDAGVRGAATHVIVAMPTATPAQRRRALALAADSGLPVVTVPGEDELRTGRGRLERLREIEPDDLLGRAPVVLDEAGVGALVRGRTVLVTGAGGSIGSELCR